MSERPRIVVASANPGKRREIASILSDFEVLSLADFPPFEPPEEGGDYVENARAKASVSARATGLLCVADDSGLEVDFLDAGPGPYSARFGGPGLDDRGRVEHLLAELVEAPPPRRARFFCVAAVATPEGEVAVGEGACPGEILLAARGEAGFGYDPVFRPEGYEVSMAELSRDEKQAISHRGRAFAALLPAIERLLAKRR